jgi:hypothetical protein
MRILYKLPAAQPFAGASVSVASAQRSEARLPASVRSSLSSSNKTSELLEGWSVSALLLQIRF